MNQVSQRTLVRMMEALGEVQTPGNPLGAILVPTLVIASQNRWWYRFLYERGFPSWFVTRGENYDFVWDKVLPALRTGVFFFTRDGNILGRRFLTSQQAIDEGETIIQRLAALLVVEQKSDAVARSLEQDGFVVDKQGRKLLPLEGPVSQQQEEDRLTALLKECKFPNEALILGHLSNASMLYGDGKDHPSLGESRSFFQALIDEIGEQTDLAQAHKIGFPAGTKNRIEYLRRVGFLTNDEESFVKSGWGALSAGAHPGVPDRDQARIGLTLALEFGQILLIKFKNWRANGYRKFK